MSLEPPRPPLLSFARWHRATADLPADRRCELFSGVCDQEAADCWQRLREELDGGRVLDGVLKLGGRRRLRAVEDRARIPAKPTSSSFYGDDVLNTISPVEYVEALTGETVPASGMVCCPLPDHDDRTPSCRVYSEPDRGWYCHGCHRGGTAIDLAARLTGIQPRGEGYKELRRYIAEKLLGRCAA